MKDSLKEKQLKLRKRIFKPRSIPIEIKSKIIHQFLLFKNNCHKKTTNINQCNQMKPIVYLKFNTLITSSHCLRCSQR
jgi:hypothetical protein